MLIRTLRAIAVCAALSTLGACAFTSADIDIQYKPVAVAPPLDAAKGIVVKVTSVDARTADLQGKVGSKKNGFGMETAPIRARQNIPLLVLDAVKQELVGRGFQIGPDKAVVAIEVAHFYADFKMGMWALENVGDVVLNVTVTDPAGQTTYSQTLKGQGSSGKAMVGDSSDAKTSLEQALVRAVDALVNDPEFIGSLTRSAPAAAPAAASS